VAQDLSHLAKAFLANPPNQRSGGKQATNTITLQIGGSLDLVLRAPPPEIEIETYVTTYYGGLIFTAKGDRMAYTLPVDKMITVQVAYVDAQGNPATVDGDVTWASSNAQVAIAEVSGDDSTICAITPVGATGTSQITATADADLGTGTRELITILDLSCVAGEAVAGTINVVGDPQPIP